MHPSQDELLRFLAGSETAERASLVYAHADACAACTDRLAALRRLRDDFDGAWNDFLAEAHARGAPVALPSASLVVRGWMDRAQRIATLAAHGLRPVADAMAALWAAPSPLPSGVGAAQPSGPAATSTLDLLVAGTRVGRIVSDAQRGSVAVLLDDAALAGRTATAIVTPAGASATPLRIRLELVPETTYRLAEFEAVPDGGFELTLEIRPTE